MSERSELVDEIVKGESKGEAYAEMERNWREAKQDAIEFEQALDAISNLCIRFKALYYRSYGEMDVLIDLINAEISDAKSGYIPF